MSGIEAAPGVVREDLMERSYIHRHKEIWRATGLRECHHVYMKQLMLN